MNKRWRLGLYVLADFRELSAPQTPNGTVLPSPLPFGLWKLPNVVFARCQLSTCISDATFSIIVSLKCYRLHHLHKHLCSQQLLKILLRFVLHWTLWQRDWGCNSCPNSTLLQMKFRFNISLSREFSIGCLWLSFESNKSRLSFFFSFSSAGVWLKKRRREWAASKMQEEVMLYSELKQTQRNTKTTHNSTLNRESHKSRK